MVTASVLALEETTPDWIRTPSRRDLHESFDHWLDTLEEAVTEKSPSLDSLARAVFASREELTAQVTEVLVQFLRMPFLPFSPRSNATTIHHFVLD
jgi:hypothetical protein